MATSTIYMKRNDTRPFLDVVLYGVDGSPIDLSGPEIQEVKFTMISAEGSSIKVNTSSNITLLPAADSNNANGSDGRLRYSWVSSDTNTAGAFLGEFQITYTNSDKLTVPTNGGVTIVILEDYDNA